MPEIILPNGQSAFQQFSNTPKPSDYWDIERKKMDVLAQELGEPPAVLYLKDVDNARNEDGTHIEGAGWTAYIKWDGCVDLNYHNPLEDTDEDDDYTHICNLDDHIERLLALRSIAKAYFERTRGEWPG